MVRADRRLHREEQLGLGLLSLLDEPEPLQDEKEPALELPKEEFLLIQEPTFQKLIDEKRDPRIPEHLYEAGFDTVINVGENVYAMTSNGLLASPEVIRTVEAFGTELAEVTERDIQFRYGVNRIPSTKRDSYATLHGQIILNPQFQRLGGRRVMSPTFTPFGNIQKILRVLGEDEEIELVSMNDIFAYMVQTGKKPNVETFLNSLCLVANQEYGSFPRGMGKPPREIGAWAFNNVFERTDQEIQIPHSHYKKREIRIIGPDGEDAEVKYLGSVANGAPVAQRGYVTGWDKRGIPLAVRRVAGRKDSNPGGRRFSAIYQEADLPDLIDRRTKRPRAFQGLLARAYIPGLQKNKHVHLVGPAQTIAEYNPTMGVMAKLLL